jgi:hypothetical protein
MKTSENAPELGLYTSECCNVELIFDKGDTLCRCPRCEHLCRWDLQEPVTLPEETKEYESEVA